MSLKQSCTLEDKHGKSIAPPGSASIVLRQPKKKGLFSFLCCGVPDNLNHLESNDAALKANKIAKIPIVRPSTASRPEQSIIGLINNTPDKAISEKCTTPQELRQELNVDDKVGDSTDNSEKIGSPLSAEVDVPQTAHSLLVTSNENESTDKVNKKLPSSQLSPPSLQTKSDPVSIPDVEHVDVEKESDLKMPGTDSISIGKTDLEQPTALPEDAPSVVSPEDTAKVTSVSPVSPENDEVSLNQSEEKQRWLLPPITPQMKGKKCLVLDLDETLVHSSFKVH